MGRNFMEQCEKKGMRRKEKPLARRMDHNRTGFYGNKGICGEKFEEWITIGQNFMETMRKERYAKGYNVLFEEKEWFTRGRNFMEER